ncbi:DUF3298 and DUF4163 domain-containing protein [Muricauda ruestringensis]|jgi:hypothetical protein|uniref:DUF3298/DUF4163 domain-containing protein n=1 Tax=Flagellimonas marinaquae TaxID=254955 RepID=A0AA48HD48_9FLAO|nr:MULTISPECIES: DUF3298 and DUF4163 domain-containing protein [Allomuricauda]MCA0958861.1 DUF3298 and DUF4163 domain-containing protein [Allomuricauda ruestringensis]USD26413.1 DUF3298 and DUF4163 domain-containing protein [Allomuricauda aquimarina]BDW92172.1 hypothetical protein MACH07_10040 [Allomuricauda aquimarina]
MKQLLGAFLFFFVLVSCQTESKLTFEPLHLKGENCESCPKIDINIPNALDNSPVSQAINRSLQEEVISILSFSEDDTIDEMGKALQSFSDSYKELRTKFPDEVQWEAEIDGIVVYEDENVITFMLNSYSFTGGAHGYASTSYLNFDKKKGVELENWQLFEDLDGFEDFAETKFRIQEKIPQDSNINSTGFMFEGESFHLPNNLGYTNEGLKLIYNQYEVASYADGPIELILPYNEINLYLKRKVKE